MELIRRMSTKSEDLDEVEISQLTSQYRRPSTTLDNEVILPDTIEPAIEIFPGSISRCQTALIVSPDSSARGWCISYAATAKHFMSAVTPATTIGISSHTKHFYTDLGNICQNSDIREKDILPSGSGSTWGKLCTLNRDVISFRKRHHVDDPYSRNCLLEMEFTMSSWDVKQLKAHIRLLSQYGDHRPMQPVPLVWKGSKTTLEGVLEWKNKPVAVCAQGAETQDGEYALYVAPGMDLYAAAIIIIAVDDRVRRASSDTRPPGDILNTVTEDRSLIY